MKQILLLIIISVSLYSCKEDTDKKVTEHIAIAKKFMKAVESKDVATMDFLLAENYVGYGPSVGDSTNKKDARATIYYVSNQGNDANNGTSKKTAWRTIAKVNASRFEPGDKILFKKGDTWNERLNPPSSGSAGNAIIFGSYGN